MSRCLKLHVALTTCVVFILGFITVLGRLEMIKPYHPMYIKSGTELTVSCESASRSENVEWVEQTAMTNWEDSVINPIVSSKFIVQTCHESPSGYTRSTLIKQNMTLNDRGTYICRDEQSNYAMWVTVIHISARTLDMPKNDEDKSNVILGCTVSGFDTNTPSIDYDWSFNGAFIPHPHKQVTAEVVHEEARLRTDEKYKVSFHDRELRLEIRQPNVDDSGLYNCSFTFKTNIGYLTLVESIRLDVSRVNLKIAAEKTFSVSLLTLVILIIVAVIAK